jgi:hypothetical protein
MVGHPVWIKGMPRTPRELPRPSVRDLVFHWGFFLPPRNQGHRGCPPSSYLATAINTSRASTGERALPAQQGPDHDPGQLHTPRPAYQEVYCASHRLTYHRHAWAPRAGEGRRGTCSDALDALDQAAIMHQSRGVLVYIRITRCHRALCCWATRRRVSEGLSGASSPVRPRLSPTMRGRVSCTLPTPHSLTPSFTEQRAAWGGQLPMVDGIVERARARVREEELELERAKADLARLEVERAAVPAFHVSVGGRSTASAAGGGGAGVGGPGHERRIPCGVHHMERRTRRAVLSPGTTAVGRTP